MSKALVNATLTILGLGNIKMKKDRYTKQVLKVNGKLVKGIALSCHSPMDCTNAPYEQIVKGMADIDYALRYGLFPLCKVGDRYIVSETSKTITYLVINQEQYPTHVPSMNLDDGYKTTYAVPCYFTEKK